MEIKNNIKFESFRNGIVDIYETDGANKLAECKESGLRFGHRTVGIKRFYEARGAQVDISSLIRIHQRRDISTQDVAVINGYRYKIVQVQQIYDTTPPVTDLTLKQMGTLMVKKNG